LVQAFLKKWWVESDFKAPNLPLSLRFKGYCMRSLTLVYVFIMHIWIKPPLKVSKELWNPVLTAKTISHGKWSMYLSFCINTNNENVQL